MNVTTKSETRRYYVSFGQSGKGIFLNGPNKGRTRTVTTCKIFLLTEASGQTLVGKGVTTLRLRPHLLTCKMALTLALDDAKLGEAANAEFWREFHKMFSAQEECSHKVKAKGSGKDWCSKDAGDCTPSASCEFLRPLSRPHGYGERYSWRQRG
jgi:hypothetical protein